MKFELWMVGISGFSPSAIRLQGYTRMWSHADQLPRLPAIVNGLSIP
ncbi:MAG: hypothetical protein H6750_19605 [Nitrospiraceae bacterium]|nr:hypothetical protein [Nitrospira sp.]MCA9457555.1 hypothetical protein [Nitrospira sp.]MCB9776517.1 hypothetical protein [Nitrospiraceae bacterium]